MNNPRILPYLLIFTAGVLWGATFSLALIATSEGTHPLTLTTWQAILTVIIAGAICLFGRVPAFRLRHLDKYLIIGLLGVVLPNTLYYHAAPHLSAGILSITVSTVPLFTYLLMWILRYESLVIRRAFGIALGMSAILLLVLPEESVQLEDASFWILWVLMCALMYALESVYIARKVDSRVRIFELLCGSNLVSLIFLLPAMIGIGAAEQMSWVFSSSAWAITGIAAIGVAAYAMYFHSIRIAGPVFASQCAYIVTIAGVLWGMVIFSERHSLWVWASVVVLLAGIALVTPSEKDTARTAA